MRILLKTVVISVFLSCPSWGQTVGSILSGTVASTSGGAVGGADVSVTNAETGRSVQTKTDAAGVYVIAGLPPGDYEVSISKEGFITGTVKVPLVAGGKQTARVVLTAAPGSPQQPSLSDLGFAPEQAKGNAAEQARLDRRSHMLKIHQRLGLITTAPLVATVLTSGGAGGRRGTSSGRQLHAALGGVTAGMYITTASLAIFAPKIQGTRVRGPIRLHRALAWIHGPGMILTPVLGALAFQQRSQGQRVHGIARAHGQVAAVTAVAYGLAIASVSIKF